MFNSGSKMEQLKDFTPTSKVQLRKFCMWFSQGDVKKATEMYDFYANGIDLPDTDPIPPTKMQSIKSSAEDIMGFVHDNQDDITTFIAFLKSIFGKGGATLNTAQKVVKPLADIN